VTADAEGLVISVTTTINNLFGSKIIVPENGIVMNNHMNDFSIPDISNGFGYLPAPANFIRPGKRPLSSMTPIIVEHLENSTFFFAVGAAGGSRIITAVVQALWLVLDLGLTPAQALAMPRFHDQLVPNEVLFDYAYDNHTVDFMRQRGHNTTWCAPGESFIQAVQQLPAGEFRASSDPNLEAGAGITC
jgi:gamma-glutamyltranspeptidase / glutathione hydrolase